MTYEEFIKNLQKPRDIELPPDCNVSDLMRDLFSKLCKYNPVN